MKTSLPPLFLALLLFTLGCGSSEPPLSDYERGLLDGYAMPDRMHQKHPLRGELQMDLGDEIGYTPSAEGETVEYQQGLTEGYYRRRGEVDAMQKPAFSDRVDRAIDR